MVVKRSENRGSGNAGVLVPPRLRGLNKKVGDVDPLHALEIPARQIARQRVIGIDERRHSPHRSALGRDPIRELLVPMHSTPPAKDTPPSGGLQVDSAPKRDSTWPHQYHGTKFTNLIHGSTICLSRSTTARGAE